MTALSYLERILDGGTDRDHWLQTRAAGVLGASDACRYVNQKSIDKYVEAKLKVSTFGGNEWTRSGHEWEPRLLGWAGIEQNTALIHAPGELGFAATPDGLSVTPEGVVLGEAKAKHNKIVYGPTPAELRQVAWQQFCVGPEVLYTDFVWAEIVDGEMRSLEPKSLRIYPGDVADLIPPMVHIATQVLARVRAARKFELEMAL
jgi:hypothetical protein